MSNDKYYYPGPCQAYYYLDSERRKGIIVKTDIIDAKTGELYDIDDICNRARRAGINEDDIFSELEWYDLTLYCI